MAKSSGLKNLNRRLEAIPKEVRKAIEPALLKSGEELAGRMRHLAPVRTGALRDSIEVTGPGQRTPAHSQPGGATTVPDHAVMVTAGNTDVRYAHLVEHGTVNAPAQPFFFPAYRLLKKRLAGRVKRAVGKSVRDNWRRG